MTILPPLKNNMLARINWHLLLNSFDYQSKLSVCIDWKLIVFLLSVKTDWILWTHIFKTELTVLFSLNCAYVGQSQQLSVIISRLLKLFYIKLLNKIIINKKILTVDTTDIDNILDF